jgi:exopolyphosphatase/guanosine-5'-triphosphate,3'-diphosphate pyrophosphatase
VGGAFLEPGVFPADAPTLAAVDLGSNSFHMLVVRVVQGELHVVDRLKEQVRLADGLDEDRHLSKEARDRAVSCLARFGERLASLPNRRVRAVGTNTLRAAKNASDLIPELEEALGHPIEIVVGREEARLVYLGVSHTQQVDPSIRRLVVDIGGGSTECVIGRGDDVEAADSLHMGHISFSKRFFDGGKITRARMERAMVGAALEVATIRKRFQETGWDVAVGSSGTALAIEAILRAQSWGEHIDPSSLARLRAALVDRKHIDRLADLEGLVEGRRPYIAGGVAILSAVVEGLGIASMGTSEGAVREGVIVDLAGPLLGKGDLRDRSVQQLAERNHVDLAQAARVQAAAEALFEQVREDRGLSDADLPLLQWAARLHEIGLVMTYGGYHKHGAYLVENSDMPGFTRDAQRLLACLVRTHRRRVRKAKSLPKSTREKGLTLAILLRLAVRLHRARGEGEVPRLTLSWPKRKRLEVRFPDGYLDAHPLTAADFEEEIRELAEAGIELTVA